ncbi:unnamed protein product [Effrenium voratum]|nr:unnamed protein product [Effrenium voratum]
MRLLAIAFHLVNADAVTCSNERLQRLLREERHRAWACDSAKLKFIQEQPWEAWALDSEEAFARLSFKVMVPHPVKEKEDLLWSLAECLGARHWTGMHVPPGRAFAVEQMQRLSPVRDWMPQLFSHLKVAGSVDFYASRVGRDSVGSYGWHTDTVDALIYVLKGNKRIKIAGHYPGSKVTMDKVLTEGSLVYVPGGRFHLLHALPQDVNAKTAELVIVLSIGLSNPNEDLLTVRTDTYRQAFEDQNLPWWDVEGQVAALPPHFPRKPEVVFAEKDALDSKGLAAIHRRVLQKDALRLTMLLHQGAEVDLRTRSLPKRPSVTALGLAACCVEEEAALTLTAKLLEFRADPRAVEFPEGTAPLSAVAVAGRRSASFAARMKMRCSASEELRPGSDGKIVLRARFWALCRLKAFAEAHSFAGAFAGALQTAFWHPLDVLKTRMQVRDGTVGSVHAYGSLRQAVQSTWQDGARGFFRGVLPNILGSSLAWGLQMPLYQQFKIFARSSKVDAHLAAKDSACSLAAGAATNVVVHPFFLIKTRLQLQLHSSSVPGGYRGALHAVETIAMEEGLRGFYRGFGPSLMLCSHGAVLLVSYDHCKLFFNSVLAASCCAKIFASVATYPLQVTRSVMQQRREAHFEYTSFPRTVQLLWQRNGLQAFYRGLFPQMLRTVPQAMAFFSIYEHVLSALQLVRPSSK